jgi:CysZ protein
MRGNPIKGVGYLFRGFGLLTKPGIRRFVIVPLVVNVLLFAMAIALLVSQFDDWVAYALSYLPSWLSFLDWLLWPLFALTILIMVYYGFSIMANFIAAPFNGFLSEKVEQLYRGEQVTEEGWGEVIKIIPQAIGRELSKMMYYLPRALILFAFTFVPLLNVVSPLLWLLFGAWMMSIQYCDYPMDNNKVPFKRMTQLLAERRLTSISFGGIVQIGSLVPILNLIVMPAAVIGATLYWLEEHVHIAVKD